MIVLQNISYFHPNKELLFSDVHLTVGAHEKIALIGNNGTGKSTLLKIIAGKLSPAGGQMTVRAKTYMVPQVFGQYDHLTVAEALQVSARLQALKAILGGDTAAAHFDMLADDWTLEERCREALEYWQLHSLELDQQMASLSGGQKTRVFLAGISIHQPELVLLDEPSNHLDATGRQLLYDYILSAKCPMIIVSHDRKLLNLPDKVYELSRNGIKVYGGNYDFYLEQKHIELQAVAHDIGSKEAALRKAREKERESMERQQKLDARGRGKQEKAGVARIMMNTLRNNAENSTARQKNTHAEKIDGISQELKALRATVPDMDKMKLDFADTALHKSKVLFSAVEVNVCYGDVPLWTEPLSLQLSGRERIALKGRNGAGKTTLLRLITGALQPASGRVYSAIRNAVYIDQEYTLIDNDLSVYGQALSFNTSGLEEHEIKIRLTRFLFSSADWDKPCSALSGGERMRLVLCCLTLGREAPDLIILDEPTNNLDIRNVGILTAAVNSYEGALVVVSHDAAFLEDIRIDRTVSLP